MIIEQQLHQLMAQLQPSHVEIINESRGHGGYFEGKESHFKVTIVSDVFQNKRAVARHQLVYALANELLASKQLHALAIHAYTPTEWTGTSPDSPDCAHAPKS